MNDIFHQFLSSESVDARKDALRELVRSKKLYGYVGTPEFESAVRQLVQHASHSDEDKDRLVSLAMLQRLWGVLKKQRKGLEASLRDACLRPLPALHLLPDPDDRLAVAQALAVAKEEWVAKFAADNIAAEDMASKTRDQLAKILISRCSIARSFELVGLALGEQAAADPVSGDVAGRKLRGAASSLRKALLLIESEPGPDAGLQLQKMIDRTFRPTGGPEQEKTKTDVVSEILGLVHNLVRTQLSLVADETVYAAGTYPKRWFGMPQLWFRTFARLLSGRRVLHDLGQALVLLGKQGIASEALLAQLRLLAGPDKAREYCKLLADHHPDLPDAVRAWLASGGVSRPPVDKMVLQEAAIASSDHLVAHALLTAQRVRAEESRSMGDANGLTAPGQTRVVPTTAKISPCTALVHEIERLAKARKIRAVGTAGDIVTYSPHAHEHVDAAKNVGLSARLIQPLVERIRPDGSPEVLVKALVESIEGTVGIAE